MGTVRERALAMLARLQLDNELELYGKTGSPTKEMRLEEGDGWKALVNMGHPCAGDGMRGVIVRKLDGEEICERFGWDEIGKAVGAEWLRREDAKRDA